MDPRADYHYSQCLVGISPSTSPPPSRKISRQSRRTHTHRDSHIDLTMSHTFEIPEAPPSPPPRAGNMSDSVYGTPEEFDPFEVGASYTVYYPSF